MFFPLQFCYLAWWWSGKNYEFLLKMLEEESNFFFGSECFFLLSANKVNLNTTHPFNSRAMWNNNLCLIFGNFFSITSISWIYKCHTDENNYSNTYIGGIQTQLQIFPPGTPCSTDYTHLFWNMGGHPNLKILSIYTYSKLHWNKGVSVVSCKTEWKVVVVVQ